MSQNDMCREFIDGCDVIRGWTSVQKKKRKREREYSLSLFECNELYMSPIYMRLLIRFIELCVDMSHIDQDPFTLYNSIQSNKDKWVNEM